MSQASTYKMGKKRLLAHPQDIHCIAYHIFCLIAYGCAFWLWLNPELAKIETVWDRVAFVGGAAYMLGWISGVDVGVNFHNHTHRRVFRSKNWNKWFGRIWTFSGGWPSFFWNHSHVVVHHANVMRDNDWTLPKKKADGSFESIYSYVFFHWPWRYAVHLYQDFTSGRGGRHVGRTALKEFAIFLAMWSVPFFIDWKMALCLWVLPQWIGNAVTMGSGMYVQHAGGMPKSKDRPMSHSTTYLSKFFNLTMFNIGYHIEHHDYPHVHWSELPAFHEKMKPKLIESGAHVVPYGYYKAAAIVAQISKQGSGYEKFVNDQAPGFAEEPVARTDERLAREGGSVEAGASLS